MVAGARTWAAGLSRAGAACRRIQAAARTASATQPHECFRGGTTKIAGPVSSGLWARCGSASVTAVWQRPTCIGWLLRAAWARSWRRCRLQQDLTGTSSKVMTTPLGACFGRGEH